MRWRNRLRKKRGCNEDIHRLLLHCADERSVPGRRSIPRISARECGILRRERQWRHCASCVVVGAKSSNADQPSSRRLALCRCIGSARFCIGVGWQLAGVQTPRQSCDNSAGIRGALCILGILPTRLAPADQFESADGGDAKFVWRAGFRATREPSADALGSSIIRSNSVAPLRRKICYRDEIVFVTEAEIFRCRG